MNYTIIHELPDRLRIYLGIPKKPLIESSEVEGSFLNISGIENVSFNCRTRNLLVHYSGEPEVRANLLKALYNLPLTLRGKKQEKNKSLQKKKNSILIAMSLMLAKPLIPPPIRPLLTFHSAMPFFWKGVKALVKKHINSNVLDSSAIGIAMGMKDYDTASIIILLLKIGDYLDEWTKQRSREKFAEMFYTGDELVWIKRENKEVRVHIKDIKEGDLVVVRSGSSIPVDGIVVEGEAMVNQSSMTGESQSVAKWQGVMVYAGTAVEDGTLIVRTISAGDDTRVAKIIKVIEESEGLKADVHSQAERLADKIVPYSFLLSGLTYALTGNPIRAASVLLVDYSCAIKLATPLAVMSAMMNASRHGVLIKGGKFIEKMAEADVFVLDKTGTLTEAIPKVVNVIPFNGFHREYVLKNAACVEEHFPHPVATAVVKRAEEEGLIHKEEHSDVKYILAHGIASEIHGKRILVGSLHFISEDNGINVECAEPVIKDIADAGHSILFVAIGNELAGIITIEDPIRRDSYRFLQLLKSERIKRIIMLTGDHKATAKNVAQRLGIDEYHAQVFPEKKTEIIKKLKNNGLTVVMIGDGMNDTPALSHADVGISMKHGADIAKEACDVILLKGDLESIIKAKRISQQSMSRIKQNFKYIIGINTILIILGLGGKLLPLLSAFMHNTSTVLVAANSLRPYHIF